MTTAPERPLRADAERNRRRLLDAAAAALAAGGLDVSVSEIAHRAGVGQGTVFRRFPTKDALVAAVLVDRIEELTATAETAESLRAFMEAFVDRHLRDRCLFEAAKARALADPGVRAAQVRLFAAIERVVEAARDAGELRPDVEAVDLPSLALGISHAAAPLLGVAPDIWRRYVAIVLDGLRPGGAPLPVAALSPADVDRVCREAGEARGKR